MIDIRLSARSIEWLRDHRLFFDYTDAERRLKPGHVLRIADNAVVEPYAGFLGPPHNGLICSMGAWSYTWSSLWPEVKVGRYSQISTDLMIPTPRHPMDLISAHPFVYDRQYSAILATSEDFGEPYSNVVPNPQPAFPIIKNDVWIGRNVVIYPGVTVGDGAMIAAHSVVIRDVPPYALVVGNPATVVRKRFPDETIDDLLQLEWWRYPFTAFNGLSLADPDRFIAELRDRAPEEYRPQPIPFHEMPRN
jgi:acetyltransferase-like isoleucine patch superfamily enzyme